MSTSGTEEGKALGRRRVVSDSEISQSSGKVKQAKPDLALARGEGAWSQEESPQSTTWPWPEVKGRGHKRGIFIYLFTELPPLTQHWAGDGDTASGAEAGEQGHSLQASTYSPSTGILGLLERSAGD